VGSLLNEVGGYRKRNSVYRIALVYPNVYQIGMANLGFHTVYSIFNGYEGVSCERFFLGMKNSIETNSPLSAFDAVGVSLQYELDYVNLIRILEASGIETSRERRTGPLLIAGGPCCYNPVPLSRFLDLFIVGDLEPVADSLVQGLLSGHSPEEIAGACEGLFSPALMNPTVAQRAPDMDSIPAPVNQPRPTSPGFSPALGSTFMIEISRGCNVRCRFCMYSHCTFPTRERSLQRIMEIVDEGIRVTGSRKVSLIGALVTDHSEIKEILSYLGDRGLTVSLPSIRSDMVDEEMLKLMERLQVRTLTLAPEGSPHTRKLIKKNLDEEKIRFLINEAPGHGVKRLRLYFISGIPGQTGEDLDYISDLGREAAASFRGRGAVTASINPLIPRPHTPTESLPIAEKRKLGAEYDLIRKSAPPRVSLKFQSIRQAHLQAYLALGGEKTGEVILGASRQSGGSASWRRIAQSVGDPMDRVFRPPASMPWRIIDAGISREYLQRQAREMMVHANPGKEP